MLTLTLQDIFWNRNESTQLGDEKVPYPDTPLFPME